jgi:GNAT superfamily N-acetyltransferase
MSAERHESSGDPGKERRFGADYQERLQLRDGTPVLLRMIRPSDKRFLLEGLQRLSPDSRYRRFLYTKDELTEEELRYLTEVDGENHVAIVAIGLDEAGREREGYAVARFVRLPQEPCCAEPAIAVIDQVQRRGLGKLLLQRISAAARERGITHFRATILASNEPVRAMIEQVEGAVIVPGNEGEEALSVDIPLLEAPDRAELHPGHPHRLMEQILAAVGSGSMVLKRIVRGALG